MVVRQEKVAAEEETVTHGMHGNCECGHHKHHHGRKGGSGGAVYGLGMIGAIVYYVSTATGFWVGVLGVLKAIVWPVFVVYELMRYLHM